MKKYFILFALTILLTSVSVKADSILVIPEKQVVSVKVDKQITIGKYKIKIEKDKNSYIYDIYNKETILPIQLGDGKYKFTLFEHAEGRMYIPILKSEKVIKNTDNRVYLQSVQNVKWDKSMCCIKYANENFKTKDKLEDTVKYIIENMRYDKELAKKVGEYYLPNIDKTFLSNKGICYDFSSMFAGMNRSQGLHTKLVFGYSDNTEEFHAWNEVLVGEWKVVDITKCINDKKFKFEDSSKYRKVKEF